MRPFSSTSIKTDTSRIMRQEELSCLVRLSRRAKADSSSHNASGARLYTSRTKQMLNKRLTKLVPDGFI